MAEDKTTRWGDNVIIADFGGRRRRKQAEAGSQADMQGAPGTPGQSKKGRPKGGKAGALGAHGYREQGFRESWAARVLMQQLVARADSGRVARGREYFRAGKVSELIFEHDSATALVAGTQLQPFDVSLSLPPLSEKQRAGILGEVLRESTEVHALASGNRPGGSIVEGLLGQATGDEQFAGLRVRCDCPDHDEVCKHVIAVGFAISEYLSEVPLRVLSWRGIDTEPVTRLMRYMQVPAIPRQDQGGDEDAVAAGTGAAVGDAAGKASVTALSGRGAGSEQAGGGREPDIVDPKEFWGTPENRVRWQPPTAEWGFESGERAQLEKAIRTVTWNTVDQLNSMSELERCYESLDDATPVFDYSHAWGEVVSEDDGKE